MMLKIVQIFGVVCVVRVHGIIKQDYTNDYDPIQEVQHAFCKIATKEIEASANATITRQLKGVCTSKELSAKLDKLENKLLREIMEIKAMLNPNLTQANVKQFISNADLAKNETPKKKKLDSVNPSNNVKKQMKRELEISKFNGTTEYNGRDKEYLYYWKIENAKDLFQQETLISENFFSSGRIYYIKLTPRHLNTKYAAFELKTAGHVKKLHRFVILNQDDARYDISSQILQDRSNFASMYRISGDKLKKFFKYDTLIVKLILYV